jgi:hypothetical protein
MIDYTIKDLEVAKTRLEHLNERWGHLPSGKPIEPAQAWYHLAAAARLDVQQIAVPTPTHPG